MSKSIIESAADYNDKVVLITGGARRLGAAIAKLLHSRGYRIVLHYFQSSTEALALSDVLNHTRANSCFVVQGDLKDVSACRDCVTKAIDHYGRLDALINNASSFYATPFSCLTEAEFDDLLHVNLKAPLFLIQSALTALIESQGVVINLGDIHGMRPLNGYSAYCSAKSGLLMLTQALAKELAPDVRVNAVAPGAILAPETQDSVEDEADMAAVLEKVPLKRQGQAEDIAKAVFFLLQDAAYVTGHILTVDGGRQLNQ